MKTSSSSQQVLQANLSPARLNHSVPLFISQQNILKKGFNPESPSSLSISPPSKKLSISHTTFSVKPPIRQSQRADSDKIWINIEQPGSNLKIKLRVSRETSIKEIDAIFQQQQKIKEDLIYYDKDKQLLSCDVVERTMSLRVERKLLRVVLKLGDGRVSEMKMSPKLLAIPAGVLAKQLGLLAASEKYQKIFYKVNQQEIMNEVVISDLAITSKVELVGTLKAAQSQVSQEQQHHSFSFIPPSTQQLQQKIELQSHLETKQIASSIVHTDYLYNYDAEFEILKYRLRKIFKRLTDQKQREDQKMMEYIKEWIQHKI